MRAVARVRSIVLAGAVLACQGCYVTAHLLAVGDRDRVEDFASHEVLATSGAVIVKTRVETYCVDACGVAKPCGTDDVWWTIDADALRRGEPTLAGATRREGRIPDALHARPLTRAGTTEASGRDELCLARDPALDASARLRVLVGCGDDRRSVAVPPPWLPTGRYRTWWSYPLLALVPATLVVDGLTLPVQAHFSSGGKPPGCPHGDW